MRGALEDLVNLFAKLPSEKKVRFLATVAHWATIEARADGYEAGTQVVNGASKRAQNSSELVRCQRCWLVQSNRTMSAPDPKRTSNVTAENHD